VGLEGELTDDRVGTLSKVEFDPRRSSILGVGDALGFSARILCRIADGAKRGRKHGGVDGGWIAIPAVLDDRPVEYTAYIVDLRRILKETSQC